MALVIDRPFALYDPTRATWQLANIPPPDAHLRMSIVIPARNEADQIVPTLNALADQRDFDGQPLDRRSFEVIVLANNCLDATAELVRRFARISGSGLCLHLCECQFPDEQAHVGSARRWLMDLACDRLEAVERPRALIASTDADTLVARDWVAASLAELDRGADAVAGVIQVDTRGLRKLGASVRRAYWQDRVHRRLLVELEAIVDPNPLDPFPRHDFHGGASLAITPRMYRKVGGLPPLACWEDVALAEALWREDARFIHSLRVRVRTSARQVGRTLGGQSQELSRWSVENATVWVKDVRRVEAELLIRRGLRRLFVARRSRTPWCWEPHPAEVAEVARTLTIEPDRLVRLMLDWSTFGQWLEALAKLQAPESGATEPEKIPIAEAIDALRSRLQELRKSNPT